jgi:ribosomal-protein-alanine N-acetyltransferase
VSGVAVRRTQRLVLRPFTDDDRAPFAALSADPVVMEHFAAPLSRAASDAFVDRVQATWRTRGWGLWALERRDSGEFIGYTGLWPVSDDVPVDAEVEVGWRLAAAHWGHGFATEAARVALSVAVELALPEVVSFTAVANLRSQAVMRRLGMTPAGEFDHPRVPVGHPARRHVLYRLRDAPRP